MNEDHIAPPPPRSSIALNLLFYYALAQVLIAAVLPLYIVPKTMAIMADLGVQLPVLTRLIFSSYKSWPLFAMLLAAGAFGWALSRRPGDNRGKLIWVFLLFAVAAVIALLLIVGVAMPVRSVTSALQ